MAKAIALLVTTVEDYNIPTVTNTVSVKIFYQPYSEYRSERCV